MIGGLLSIAYCPPRRATGTLHSRWTCRSHFPTVAFGTHGSLLSRTSNVSLQALLQDWIYRTTVLCWLSFLSLDTRTSISARDSCLSWKAIVSFAVYITLATCYEHCHSHQGGQPTEASHGPKYSFISDSQRQALEKRTDEEASSSSLTVSWLLIAHWTHMRTCN